MSIGIVKSMTFKQFNSPNRGTLIDISTGAEYPFLRPDVAVGTVPSTWDVKLHDAVTYDVENGVAVNVTLYKKADEEYVFTSFPNSNI